ncbi:MAG: prolipoprotein diacylglyceryl transferase, partial [Chitinophagia bacterium]|nr:prolipoprotein diacylglyceryl transferase [Chitinophagia bacterium]
MPVLPAVTGFVFQSPGPMLIELGPLAIRWYGLLIALAVLLGLVISSRLARRRGFESGLISDLLPLLVLAAVVGARAYYVLFEWRQYRLNWLEALQIWRGGIAIHGALIGGVLAVIAFCRWRRLSFWSLMDVLVPSVALGQAIGRWGNFFNSEAFGLPTNLPWKLWIPAVNRPSGYLGQAWFHPTFLYESLWDFALFLILIVLVLRRRPGPAAGSSPGPCAGRCRLRGCPRGRGGRAAGPRSRNAPGCRPARTGRLRRHSAARVHHRLGAAAPARSGSETARNPRGIHTETWG